MQLHVELNVRLTVEVDVRSLVSDKQLEENSETFKRKEELI